MKCRAKKVMLEAWEDRLTREYGAKAIGAIQHEAARLILGGFPWFTVAPERLNGFFRDQGEICESELNGNLSETIYVKDRRGRHKGDRFDLFHEAAEDTIFRLGRDLGGHGIDADELFEVGKDFIRGVFNGIWDSTIKKSDLPLYGWDANPWVWVVEFGRIGGEEDGENGTDPTD